MVWSMYCGTDYAAWLVHAINHGHDSAHVPGGIAGEIDQAQEKGRVKDTHGYITHRGQFVFAIYLLRTHLEFGQGVGLTIWCRILLTDIERSCCLLQPLSVSDYSCEQKLDVYQKYNFENQILEKLFLFQLGVHVKIQFQIELSNLQLTNLEFFFLSFFFLL